MGDNYGPPPKRGAEHERLGVFVGQWRAEGTSFGGGSPARWISEETTRFHDGGFFLIQDERAKIGDGSELLTHAVIGFDGTSYYAHAVENHGFYRRYDVRNDGRIWTFASSTERARIEFSDDGNKQTVVWEWRPRDDRWVPLCERVNVRQ